LAASFATGLTLFSHPVIIVPWILAAGGLMVSTLPTFSFKKLRVPHEYAVPGLALVGLYAAALATQPWWTLLFTGLAYLASIPLSVRQYQRLQRAATALQEDDAAKEPEAGDGI
jgi:CDP-diacylglycerol---serine O-phosphatidyltransferase